MLSTGSTNRTRQNRVQRLLRGSLGTATRHLPVSSAQPLISNVNSNNSTIEFSNRETNSNTDVSEFSNTNSNNNVLSIYEAENTVESNKPALVATAAENSRKSPITKHRTSPVYDPKKVLLMPSTTSIHTANVIPSSRHRTSRFRVRTKRNTNKRMVGPRIFFTKKNRRRGGFKP